MAQPLDKISVFNTGPSKNDLAIERLQKEMARLGGQMGLVSLQHNAIKQDQAKISKDFDALEVRITAEKKMQDEWDENIMDRLMKIEAVLWPYKRREDGWDVEDQEPLLDWVTRLDVRIKADKEAQDEYDETLMNRLTKIEDLLWPYMRHMHRSDDMRQYSLLDRVTRLQEHDEKITGQITKIEDLLWPHMRHMDRPEDVRRHSLVTRIEWMERALNEAKIHTVPVMLAHYNDAIMELDTRMQDITRDVDILRTRVFQTKDVSTHVLYAPLPITLS